MAARLVAAPSFEERARKRVRAPQRLCSLSSELPLFSVSEHGVDDGEDLSSDRDEGDHFGLTSGEQMLVEALQRWVPANRRERSHVEGGAHGRPAAGDHAFALPSTGLTREGGKAGETCDLASRQAAELWQFGKEGPSQRVADSRTVTSRSSFSRQAGELRTSVPISVSISAN